MRTNVTNRLVETCILLGIILAVIVLLNTLA